MSDIPDPLTVLQHRMQQRQILAMMGINQWIQPSSNTIDMADIAAPTISDSIIDMSAQTASSATNTEQPSIEKQDTDTANTDIASVGAISAVIDDESISSYYHDAHDPGLTQPNEQSPVTYSFDSSTPDVAVRPLVEQIVQQTTASIEQSSLSNHIDNDDGLKKIAPFDLQGGRYGDWVVLVDIQALNQDSQKLWQNITQALSITCETTSFPICEGMDSAELANASLAGYVFKVGRSEEIQVIALTALPEGLEHPTLAIVPTLDEMLADSGLKRQLWEKLSS